MSISDIRKYIFISTTSRRKDCSGSTDCVPMANGLHGSRVQGSGVWIFLHTIWDRAVLFEALQNSLKLH